MIKKRMNAKVQQNIGLIALLICSFTVAMIIRAVEKDLLIEQIVITAGIFIIIILAITSKKNYFLVFAGAQTVFYIGYLLVRISMDGIKLTGIRYVWMVLPAIIAIITYMYVLGNKRLEMELDVLKEKEEELVMISQVTGLYNLRSLYNDIRMLKAYADRNNLVLSLMIIKVQFKTDWEKSIPIDQYHGIMREIGMVVTDVVRIEDRTYSIDDERTFGVLLICDKEGSSYVSNRIEKQLGNKETLAHLIKGKIDIDVKIACKEFKKEDYGDDVILFKQMVENELS